MLKYTADFETNNSETECRVWAYAICEISNPDNIIIGNNISDFIKWCESARNPVIYFHNLKFDGAYIISYLLNNNYEWVQDKKDRRDKTFTTLISDMGVWYSIEIYFKVGKKPVKVKILDSMKILNFSVEKIAKDFNLPVSKLSIDYDLIREENHVLTSEETEYIKADVKIMALALNQIFNAGLTKMTIGSDALDMYKKTISRFDAYYPQIPYEQDKEIRASYKGGWTYLNPIYKDKKVGRGIVIDKNSMYPSHLYYDALPIGLPVFYSGNYKEDKLYNLYVQVLSCSFKIKEGKLPTIQLKNSMRFLPTEYLTSSDGEIITLTLTCVDLQLFLDHYDVKHLVYHHGYKFKSAVGLFREYIDVWSNEKAQAKINNNGAMYVTSKLLLNSLYGKFGLNPRCRSKKPYLDDGVLKFKLLDEEIRDTIYLPVATFTTAYSRNDIIRTAQRIRDYTKEKYGEDYFIYSDTDSIHCRYLTESELEKFVPLHDYKLNYYKVENEFKEGMFIRAKTYIEIDDEGKTSSTIAGLPKKLAGDITLDNFKSGYVNHNKLRPKQVKGGVILVKTDFTIK